MNEFIHIGSLLMYYRAPLDRAKCNKRYSMQQLNPGDPTAHKVTYLMLLPSGPDMVHKALLRRTGTSTLCGQGRLHYIALTSGIQSC